MSIVGKADANGRYSITAPIKDGAVWGTVKIQDKTRVAPDIEVQGVTESKDLGISYLSERVKVYGNVIEIYDDIEGENERPIDNVEVKIIVVSDTGQKDTYKCVTDQYGYFEMFTKTNRHGVMTYWKEDLVQYVCNIDIAHEDLDRSLRIRLDA